MLRLEKVRRENGALETAHYFTKSSNVMKISCPCLKIVKYVEEKRSSVSVV